MTNLTQEQRRLKSELLGLMEERFQRLAKKKFEAFATEVQEEIGEPLALHHRFLCDELQLVADGYTKRLMICLPPGSAKSRYGSKLFPAWFLARKPRTNIILSCNTSDLAEEFSVEAQKIVVAQSKLLKVTLDKQSAGNWSTTERSICRAVGVGSTITGRRADLAIIDDPIKGREESESLDRREKQWSWFMSDLRTRLKPGAPIVVIMTRWHEDDLGGRLISRQPDMWKVISIPAIAEENDPLGRAPGEWLWDGGDDYGYGKELRQLYKEYNDAGSTRDWQSLYQQHPRPAEGSIFKINRIRYVDAIPAGTRFVRAWDIAATAQLGKRDPDWTVGIKLGVTPIGRYIISDVVRFRDGPDVVRSSIQNTATQDGKNVEVGFPDDPGAAGTFQVFELTKMLAGWNVSSSPESGSKETRAAPFASQVNIGNLDILSDRVPSGELRTTPWNAILSDELGAFPNGTKDDQVDALSRAFMMLTASPKPMKITKKSLGRL